MRRGNYTYNGVIPGPKSPYVILNKSTMWGSRIQFEDDSAEYHLQPGQKWLPHEVSGYHP